MFRWIRKLFCRARRSRIIPWAALGQVALVHLLMIFSVPLLFADDCTRDWRRAED
jgi:hypothetical protein